MLNKDKYNIMACKKLAESSSGFDMSGYLYLYTIFDQRRVDIIDKVEYGVHDRLHIYPLCESHRTSVPVSNRYIDWPKMSCREVWRDPGRKAGPGKKLTPHSSHSGLGRMLRLETGIVL